MRLELMIFQDGSGTEAYRCTQPNCSYYYNLIHGYFVHSLGGYGEDDSEWRRLCESDGSPMYLSGIDDNGEQVWRCARAGCTAG
jgi:hypothetical protein